MEVKPINNLEKEILDLLTMQLNLDKLCRPEIMPLQSIINFVGIIASQKDFIALGLYEKNKLTGFIAGHDYDNYTFHIMSLYSKHKLKGTKKLIDSLINIVKDKNYKYITCDTYFEKVFTIAKKYEFKLNYIRCRKEL